MSDPRRDKQIAWTIISAVVLALLAGVGRLEWWFWTLPLTYQAHSFSDYLSITLAFSGVLALIGVGCFAGFVGVVACWDWWTLPGEEV